MDSSSWLFRSFSLAILILVVIGLIVYRGESKLIRGKCRSQPDMSLEMGDLVNPAVPKIRGSTRVFPITRDGEMVNGFMRFVA
jgi:hypothetical protein